MTRSFWHELWLILVGRRLAESVQRNARAADDLDAAVKETLKR